MEPEDRLPARVGGVDERITNPPDIDHAVVGELRFRLEGAARSGYAARCSLSLDALAPSPLPLRGGRKSAHSAVSKT